MVECGKHEQEPTLADDLHPLLPYIMKLQDGQARLETKVDSLTGLHSRVDSLETDRASVKAVAGAAGVAGGFLGWLFHLWVKSSS